MSQAAVREYKQYCGIAKALDVVGGRWSLLLVRELLLGPRRYSQLLHNLAGITPNLLAKRLRELETYEVITRPGPRAPWELTVHGRTLEPVLLALGRFGSRWMGSPQDHSTNGRWYAVSLQRRYRGGIGPFTMHLSIDGESYSVTVSPTRLVSRDGPPSDAELTIRGSLPQVVEALSQEAGSAGGVVEGNQWHLKELQAALD